MTIETSKALHSPQDLSLTILQQLPGLLVVSDEQQRLFASNAFTAKLFGYPDVESMMGMGPYDMKCPAVECADQFIEQDKLVQKLGKQLTILDIHKYASGESKIFLTKKSPFYKDNEIKGCIIFCTEIVSTTLASICTTLVRTDKKYHDNKHQSERSYTIGDIAKEQILSKREMDCLFYLLRGKTSKEIGKVLGLSPRTIESYFDNIKAKFGCKYKFEIVEYALAEGYLYYVPNQVVFNDLTHVIHQVGDDI